MPVLTVLLGVKKYVDLACFKLILGHLKETGN